MSAEFFVRASAVAVASLFLGCSSPTTAAPSRSVGTGSGGAGIEDAAVHGGASGAGSGGTGGKGTPYACVGGEVRRNVPIGAPDGGQKRDAAADGASRGAAPPPSMQKVVPWTGTFGSCTVGESYCNVRSFQDALDFLPMGDCVPLTGALAPCADNPDCACICSHGVQCYTECSCKDNDAGVATVACSQI